MPQQDIPLGPWRPDQGDLQHDGMAVAKNVYPIPNGYSLHPKADAVSTSTIDAIARGGFSVIDNSGNANLFVGNATKLYRRTGTTFSDVSSAAYTTASADHWEFSTYENVVIATNYTDSIQKFDLNTGSAFEGLNLNVTAADFDGADDYLRAPNANLTGLQNGKKGSLSAWVRLDGGNATLMSIFGNTPDTAAFGGFKFYRDSTNEFVIGGWNTSGTQILELRSNTTYTSSASYIHVMASWDLSAGTGHIYINGADDKKAGATLTNEQVPYKVLNWSVGVEGNNIGAAEDFNGAVSELYFADEYIDLSVSANRLKFYGASGAPVYLERDGSGPTGNIPAVYLKSIVSGKNSGYSDNFNVNGGVASTTAPNSGDYEGIDNTTPNARHVAAVGDFIMVGNTNEDRNGAVGHKVQWSAIGNPDDWPIPGTTDAQDKQADEEFLDPAFGPIRGIAGGKDFGLVFQENAITRFTYIGGTAIFEVDPFERQRGLIAPRAFAQVGTKTYFISQGGAYVTDGVNVEPIGDGVIDQTLVDDIDRSNLNYLSTAVDLDNKLIYFAIPGSTGSDRVYIYHYLENRWSYGVWTDLIGDATAQVGCVVQGHTLDTSKNPRVWVLGGYNEGAGVLHKLREFTGDFAPFTLRTAVQEFPQMFYMDGASIYGDSNSTFGPSTDVPFKVYASESSLIGISDGESDVHTASTTGAANARTGRVDFRITGRTASFELSASAAITTPTIQKVQKFRVYYQPAGDA